jgi:hypothetical protein
MVRLEGTASSVLCFILGSDKKSAAPPNYASFKREFGFPTGLELWAVLFCVCP